MDEPVRHRLQRRRPLVVRRPRDEVAGVKRVVPKLHRRQPLFLMKQRKLLVAKAAAMLVRQQRHLARLNRQVRQPVHKRVVSLAD